MKESCREENQNFQYSVLIPVYCKEQPSYLVRSLNSMLRQSIPAKEIVIVEDGVLTEGLDAVIFQYVEKFPHLFHIVKNKEHVGLGNVLKIGVEHCKCDYIARMDADDISEPFRIEREWNLMQEYPDLDIVGCIYDEFQQEGILGCIRNLPKTPEDILDFAHKRNPFGHSSLLIRKKAILEVGNYHDYPGVEDYELWVRMFMNGAKGYNIQEPLVHVRAGMDFYNRRGGLHYLRHLNRFFITYHKLGFFSMKDYIFTIAVRTCVCLMPGVLRNQVYKKFLRTEANKPAEVVSIERVASAEHVYQKI